MNDLKLALLGFGNAGQAFVKMLSEKLPEIQRIYGRSVKVTAIATASKGTIIDAGGIDLLQVCADMESLQMIDLDFVIRMRWQLLKKLTVM